MFNEKRNGYFLDIGAHDGIHISNTYLLERRYGWSGICIEANRDTFLKLQKNRKATCVNACLDSCERSVQFAAEGAFGGIVSPDTDNRASDSRNVVPMRTTTLNSLLRKQGAPRQMDYLSIDVEGAEERVFAGFDLQEYGFKCMTVERPSPGLRRKLSEHSYVLIKEIPGYDCFYVHDSFLKQYANNALAFYSKVFWVWPRW